MAKSKTKIFTPGDLVRYTARFLRSTGQYASNRLDGVVVGASPSMGPGFVYVSWNDHPFPSLVNTANLEKKATSRVPGALINDVRAATGIPIWKTPSAEDDKYRVFTPHRDPNRLWDLFSWRDSYRDAESAAVSLHDNEGLSVVVLAPGTSDVVFAMESDRQANPARRGVKILGRYYNYDSAVRAARVKSKALGHAVYVDALKSSAEDRTKPWFVWETGDHGDPTPESLFGGRYMETLVEGHLVRNPAMTSREGNPSDITAASAIAERLARGEH